MAALHIQTCYDRNQCPWAQHAVPQVGSIIFHLRMQPLFIGGGLCKIACTLNLTPLEIAYYGHCDHTSYIGLSSKCKVGTKYEKSFVYNTYIRKSLGIFLLPQRGLHAPSNVCAMKFCPPPCKGLHWNFAHPQFACTEIYAPPPVSCPR